MTNKDHPEKTGAFLGLPYDWRKPNLARFKERVWNPNDRRVFTPKSYGWGLSVNFHEIVARLHLKKRP